MGARPGKRKPRSPGAHRALSRALPSIGCRLSPPPAGSRSHSKAPCLTGNTMALWCPQVNMGTSPLHLPVAWVHSFGD